MQKKCLRQNSCSLPERNPPSFAKEDLGQQQFGRELGSFKFY
jgi:hypothetical protein